MKAKPFPTLREAIHHTATASGIPMKAVAADLDLSPSELSMRTTLGEDGRAFPADKLIRLQELTGDVSILLTMADRLGYEIRPKRDRLPEMIASTGQQVAELIRTFEQMKLMIPLADTVGGKRGKP